MKKKNIIVLLSIIILAVLAGGFWFVGNQENKKETANSQSVIQEEQEAGNEIDTSDWLTYRNEEYGFEVNYPKDWEYDTIDGITFGDKKHCEKDELDYYWCKNYIVFVKSEMQMASKKFIL